MDEDIYLWMRFIYRWYATLVVLKVLLALERNTAEWIPLARRSLRGCARSFARVQIRGIFEFHQYTPAITDSGGNGCRSGAAAIRCVINKLLGADGKKRVLIRGLYIITERPYR